MAISPRTIDRIKAASLSSVVETLGGQLKRVGHEYLTQCPWHDDTNPSLTINDEKGFCFCHVCRGGGDAIAYIQQRNGMAFRDAVEKAAGILGINVETDNEDPAVTARRAAERKAAVAQNEKEQEVFRSKLRDPRAGGRSGAVPGR